MTMTTFSIPIATKPLMATDLLADEAKKRCRLISNKVVLSKTTTGLSLSLHNKGMRPTVYSVEVKPDRYGFADNIVLDTIIAENKTHQCLKVTWRHHQAIHIINLLASLSEQECDGSRDETLTKYEPLGLLYRAIKESAQ